MSFDTKLIRITNNEAFKNMLSDKLIQHTEKMTQVIRQKYKEEYGAELRISARSLTVEIWGHVYGEYFFYYIHQKLHRNLTRKLYQFVRKRCEIIDSGEKSIDNNRLLWDAMSPFKSLLGWLLNNRIQKSHKRSHG